VRPPGPLLAAGRDADIFEYGEGLVLRRARDGRSLADEARAMEYLRGQGYPVPAVDEMSDDGSDLVIERIDGPSMVQAIGARPWAVRGHARTLAELHLRLHDIGAPEFMRPAPIGAGTAMLHLDLHPLNVIMGPTGPVVIDWTGAAVGDPDIDVGLAWVPMAAGEIPGNRVAAALLGWGRGLLLGAFLARFDRRRVAGKLRAVVAVKAQDPHMSAAEVARMWNVVERAERRT
jgi:aminoglycoside phosphotransferase (APT) family kinase protein